VQSVYRSFFTNVREGRYDVESGRDLWQLLVTITLHKVHDQLDRFSAGKWAIERELNFGSEDSLFGLQAHMLARDPSPVEALALTEAVEHVMRGLHPVQRRMLEMRLQGYNLEEIAGETQRNECTVRRLDIQEALLYLSPIERGRAPVMLADLQPIAALADWARQRRRWRDLWAVRNAEGLRPRDS